MNREIKFRVWDTWRNKMICDGATQDGTILLINFKGEVEGYDDEDGGKSGLWEHSIDVRGHFTPIMQFTGVKGRNGIDIYEGDIIKYRYDTTNFYFRGEIIFTKQIIRIGYEGDEVLFIGFVFRGKEKNGDYWYAKFPNVKDIEVIGNIYENPELLK
jgi:uncharacterized phage protein (TIGR01671 family)